ncbi:DinB family protein [Microlunatus soli]|uniref:Uncharacterized damage-inducible protein DinB (Forms a four-helix bundle) n=1 Tax=Microlunatus soli TaxID=630515 RepID=A0A1H1T9U3_9ACTN|nr:DinB family protein [Microlunatus soli]SDS57012.1 Uncharacterized damage-inducible protein DinB (forms a four-helix bundle) [Microlunatus soli]
MANAVLHDIVRHNTWATRALIDFVIAQRLTPDQLTATGVGTFGTIPQTLEHIVICDASYLRRLAIIDIGWVDTPTVLDLSVLRDRAEELIDRWDRCLAGPPIDTERIVLVDDDTEQTRAGILLAQAINHANHHREQVCAILTGLGIQPPDIQAWEYAWQSGRISAVDDCH